MTEQMHKIFTVARNRWLTLEKIAEESGQRIASVSAQLRHIRNKRQGAPRGWTLIKRLVECSANGNHWSKYEYKVAKRRKR